MERKEIESANKSDVCVRALVRVCVCVCVLKGEKKNVNIERETKGGGWGREREREEDFSCAMGPFLKYMVFFLCASW